MTGSAKRAMRRNRVVERHGLPGVSLTMIARTFMSRRNSESSAVSVWLMVPR